MNHALRTYRPKRRLGSSPSRKAHSRPVFCIQRGARRMRPAANSRECANLDADWNAQFLKVLIDPPLALWLTERDKENVGPG